MDILSYLLGKSSSGGGSDISEYFDKIKSGNANAPGILNSILKVPPLAMTGTSCNYMYSRLQNATEIDCSLLDTSNVTTMNGMFNGCYALKRLDLSNLYTPNVTNMQSIFNNCIALEFLDIRNFTFGLVSSGSFSSAFQYVPNDCLIIVKDDTEKQYIVNAYSNLTNVKTVEEYEGS